MDGASEGPRIQLELWNDFRPLRIEYLRAARVIVENKALPSGLLYKVCHLCFAASLLRLIWLVIIELSFGLCKLNIYFPSEKPRWCEQAGKQFIRKFEIEYSMQTTSITMPLYFEQTHFFYFCYRFSQRYCAYKARLRLWTSLSSACTLHMVAWKSRTKSTADRIAAAFKMKILSCHVSSKLLCENLSLAQANMDRLITSLDWKLEKL